MGLCLLIGTAVLPEPPDKHECWPARASAPGGGADRQPCVVKGPCPQVRGQARLAATAQSQRMVGRARCNTRCELVFELGDHRLQMRDDVFG